jgi:uncharacterized membrane protein YoaK (UPF0700 family)
MLLAAGAGAADVLAFFGVGHAFAGIVTGNLATAGYGIVTGDAALIQPTITAVLACIAGELVWGAILRGRTAVALLLVELVLIALVLAGWLLTETHPTGTNALVLLALVAFALGGQSIWALRVHQTTTYFTGMLTRTIDAAASGAYAGIATSARQLGAFLSGAVVSGLVLHHLRPATPAVPLVLLAAATAVHLRTRSRPGPRPAAPTPDAG